MAILANLPGIELTIKCNGQALKEYDDDETEEHIGKDATEYGGEKISKYVECRPGQEFSVAVSLERNFKRSSPYVDVRVDLEGTHQSGELIKTSRSAPLPQEVTIDGTWNKNLQKKCYEKKAFQFSALKPSEYSDHDLINADCNPASSERALISVQNDKKNLEKLGTIVIRVYRTGKLKTWTIRGGKTKAPIGDVAATNNSKSNTFHERALKGTAKSLGVRYVYVRSDLIKTK